MCFRTYVPFDGAIIIILLVVGSVIYLLVRKVKRMAQTKKAFTVSHQKKY